MVYLRSKETIRNVEIDRAFFDRSLSTRKHNFERIDFRKGFAKI